MTTFNITPTTSSSLNTAYIAAQPGDTIIIAPGSYAFGCEVFYHAAKENAASVTVVATGATFTGLFLRGVQNMIIDGMTITGLWEIRVNTSTGLISTSKLPTNLEFYNITSRVFLFRNVQGMILADSSIGGQDVSTSGLGVPKVGAAPQETAGFPEQPLRNCVIDNVFFHDIIRTQTQTTHCEGLYLDAGIDGLTVSNCWFTNCGVFDIFSNGVNGARGITNVIIEDCMLDVPRDTIGNVAASAIKFKGGAGLITVRNNSIYGGVLLDGASYQWVSQLNAIGGANNPQRGVTDVWSTGNPGFVSASQAQCNLASCFRNDLHVTPGSTAGLAGAGVPVGGSAPPPPPPPPPDPTAEADEIYFINASIAT